MLNKHTDEEYVKIQEYHKKLRPNEYATSFDGKVVRNPAKSPLEEELALPLERRKVIVAKLQEDWDSTNGQSFRRLVGETTALHLYARLVMQLETGKLWPGDPNPEKQPSVG
jgi:hypothetical protein